MTEDTKEHLCQLCGKAAPILQSHVLPAFIFRWLKQAGHIRHSVTPNRRTQDGVVAEWLCRECEDLFNSFETPFATRIFHPYDRDRNIRVRYDGWLLKFCVSVAWRSLLYLKRDGHTTCFNDQQVNLIDEALRTWTRFLLGEYKHVGAFEVHLLAFSELVDGGQANLPTNINRYLTRTVDINAGSGNTAGFVYSKFGPFAILGFVELVHAKQWKGTKVSHRGGWFEPGNYTVPNELLRISG